MSNKSWGNPYGIMVNMPDCNIVASKFLLQSCYYVLFMTNILRKGMNPIIYGLNSDTTVFLQVWH